MKWLKGKELIALTLSVPKFTVLMSGTTFIFMVIQVYPVLSKTLLCHYLGLGHFVQTEAESSLHLGLG